MWNVNTETLAGGDRTNNLAETWKPPPPRTKAFAVLVGHSHPSVLVTVEAFQTDPGLSEIKDKLKLKKYNCLKCKADDRIYIC